MNTKAKKIAAATIATAALAGSLAVGGIGKKSIEVPITKIQQICYSAFENAQKQQVVEQTDCDTYHWLGAGPGDRRPAAPEGYTWKWSGADVVPKDGEYVLHDDYLYVGETGKRPLKLDRSQYTITEDGGISVFPDPDGISIKNGKLRKTKDNASLVTWLGTRANAAVAVDTATTAQNNLSTVTWSHTVTGSDTILIVGVTHQQGSTGITSVTYAGAALTDHGTADGSGDDSDIWYKASPTTGANNVEVTIGIADNKIGHAVSFTGSDGTVDTLVTSTGQWPTAPSNNVSSAVGDFVVDVVGVGSGVSASPDAGQTQQTTNTSGSSKGYTSTETGAATVTMSWTRTAGGNDNWSHAAVNINAGTQGGGGGTPTPKPRRVVY